MNFKKKFSLSSFFHFYYLCEPYISDAVLVSRVQAMPIDLKLHVTQTVFF